MDEPRGGCVQPVRDAAALPAGMGLRPGGERPDIEALVRRWQQHVHQPGIYNLEIDTSTVTPETAAAMIRSRLQGPPPSAFRQLAAEG